MTETEKILDAAQFMEKSQGYVDINSIQDMTGIPAIVIQNVLEQNEYFESGIKGQFQKV